MNFPPDFYWKNNRLQKLTLCKIYNEYKRNNCGNCATEEWVQNYYAPIYNPIFTGNPQAPNPSLGNYSSSIATTAFVQDTILNELKLSSNTFVYNNSFNTGIMPDTSTTNSDFYINYYNQNGPNSYSIYFTIYYQIVVKNASNELEYFVGLSSVNSLDTIKTNLNNAPASTYCKYCLYVDSNGITPIELINTNSPLSLTTLYNDSNNHSYKPFQFTLVDNKIKVQLSFPDEQFLNYNNYKPIQYCASFLLEQSGRTIVDSSSRDGIDNLNTSQLFPNKDYTSGTFYLSK